MHAKQTPNLFGHEEEPTQSGRVIQVAFDSGVDATFSYLLPDQLGPIQPGQRIEAPFGRGNKSAVGFCVDIGSDEQTKPDFKLKAVTKIIDTEPLLDQELMELARWISDYYVCPLGQVLSAMVPAAVKKGIGVQTESIVYLAGIEQPNLTSKKQQRIVEVLTESGAADEKSALSKSVLLERAQCTDAVLKTLLRHGIIKMAKKAVLKALPAIPEGLRLTTNHVVLNEDQNKALDHIRSQLNTKKFGVTLLHGVTDSGKTEVYIRAIEHVIQSGKQAIVLLPEIALTAQTVERFAGRFERIAVMHSQLTAAQRNAQWQTIRSGEADVVIGARSAIFAPLSRLGLVVVDEEHEPSYKQDTLPRYHGRDVAIKRAHLAAAHVILGSATPSLESLLNSQIRDHYIRIQLTKRVMDLPMPEMQLVDMKGCFSIDRIQLISPTLKTHIETILTRNEQAILLLNRRGYSSLVFCPSCRHMLHCRNCDVTLTFHKRPVGKSANLISKHLPQGYAICHHCLSKTLVPQKCPLCNKKMAMVGLGSQRLEEELAETFPGARIARIDSDSMAGEDYYSLLDDFAAGKIDILAGTQMLAKGLHFPNVTLVGVISADTALTIADFRSNERTFQLLCQVAGRAGRSEKKGSVIVQTLHKDNHAIQMALRNDYEEFARCELQARRSWNLPPFWRMAVVGLRDPKFDRLTQAAHALKERIDVIVEHNKLEIKSQGPIPAMISRISRYHRMQIILQAPNAAILQALFAALRAAPPIRPAVTITYDVDPVNLL